MKIKFLFFFLLTAISIQCTSNDGGTVVQEPVTKGPFTYLALGDSYTIGHSVPENGRFPVQLSDSLTTNGYEVTETRIIAKTGWTTDELQTGIDNAMELDSTYDFVSLLIGVNNQFRGRSVEDYKPEFKALLEQSIDFAGGNKDRVFVVSIPDYAFTPFGNGNTSISDGIDDFNAANKEVSEELGILYFDITPISREGIDQTDLVASDGLHPSEEQYRRWVELMLEEVKGILD